MRTVQDLRTRGPLHLPESSTTSEPAAARTPPSAFHSSAPRAVHHCWICHFAGADRESGNTLLLTAESTPPPDPVALAVTCGSDDGEERVVNLPEDTCK
jgi:hypothetical protein